MESIRFRNIERSDDPALSRIVKNTMAEFGVNRPNTVYFDPTTDHLSEVFSHPRSVYNIAELNGEMVGGAGIYPTDGLPPDTCELVKMYLLPKARGLGLGKTLIEKCMEQAKDLGYTKIYLESMPELKQAIRLYKSFGWQPLEKQMGNSGHTGCAVWMIKDLENKT